MWTILSLLITALVRLNTAQMTINVTLIVWSDVIVNRIPEMYFGFTMDWWKPTDGQNGYKWGDASILWLNLSNPILINLTKALTPAMLRLGGSPEDSIVYNMSGMCLTSHSEQYGCSQTGGNYGCLNESRWKQILHFMDETQLSVIFGLNACFGRLNRSSLMNYTNIEQLLNFTIKQYESGFVSTPIYGFELGNEIQWSIDGNIYAQDFVNIQSILNETWSNNKLSNNIPYMIGPDVEQGSQGWQWNKLILETLNDITNGNVPLIQRANTYHHYPNCGSPNGNISVFSLNCLSSIGFYARNYTKELADYYGVDVFMGEGSEHSGGGILNLTNVFISSFYYLYQLCELANNGIKGTLRSDLIGGYYELINHTTTIPTPDYWILYLWRQYIGDIMYNSTLFPSPINQETYIRAYSFSYKYNINDYLIVLINYHLWNTALVNITIQNDATRKFFYGYDEYHIVGIGADGLKTKDIQVNGVEMKYDINNGQFPNLKGKPGNGIVTLQPKTISLVHVYQTTKRERESERESESESESERKTKQE